MRATAPGKVREMNQARGASGDLDRAGRPTGHNIFFYQDLSQRTGAEGMEPGPLARYRLSRVLVPFLGACILST